MAVMGAIVVAAAAVALTGYPSLRVASVAPTSSVAGSGQPEVHAQPVKVAAPVPAVAAQAHPPKVIVEKSKPTPNATTRSSASDYVPPAPAVTAAFDAPATPEAVITERNTGASAIAQATSVSEAVTISGCLEMTVEEDQFRLTDTDGSDAPKARSWKSGFLKKRSAAVDLVGFSDAPTLRKNVGHRVAATGVLTGRQLHVSSVQAGGPSCE